MTSATVPSSHSSSPSSPHSTSDSGDAPPSRRARAAAVLLVGIYGLLSLWAVVLSAAGVVPVVTGRLPDPSLWFVGVAATGFKVLSVGPALGVFVSRGRSILAVRLLLLGQVVWFVADLLSPQADDGPLGAVLRLLLSLVIWVGPWVALSPRRRRLWPRSTASVRRPVAALAVVGAVPLVLWSVAASGTLLPPSLGPEEASELRFDLCGLPLVVLVALVVAAFERAGWWDLLVGLLTGTVAVLAVAGGSRPGSPGLPGAALLLVPLVLVVPRLSRTRADSSRATP